MPAFTANDLAAYQAAGGQTFGQAMPQKKKSNAWISFLPSALAAGASLIPGVGTAAAAGLGGLGELGRQVLSGEGVNIGKIGLEAGLSAIPGGIGKLGKLAKGGEEVARAGGLLSKLTKGGEAAANVASTARTAKGIESGVSGAGKLSSVGTDLRAGVVNPQVRAGVSGAQQEAAIADRLSQVKGLTPKGKYGNLQSEMDAVSSKIDPILSKSTGTINSSDMLTKIRSNAEQSGHFLAGDPTYEKQLSSVISDLSTKTGGTQKLTARQLYDYKKGMDMNSVFTKLEKGADLNPKEAARLSVWSELDNGITAAAPEVKSLTKEQSLLMQGAPGLKKASTKTAGIPLLGIKSQTAEQGIQAGKELAGRTLQAVGGNGKIPTYGRSLFGQLATRAVATPLTAGMNQQAEAATPGDQAYQTNPDGSFSPTDPNNMNDTFTASQAAASAPKGMFNPATQQEDTGAQLMTAAKHALASGDSKGLENIMKVYSLYESMAKLNASGGKKLNATQQQQANNATTGLDALDQIESELSKNPSLQAKTVIPGRSLLGGLGNKILGTGTYDAARKQAMDVIARLRTGAAISAKEEKLYMDMLPQGNDDAKTSAYKLNTLRGLFTKFAQPGEAAAPDPQELLASLGA